MNSIDAVRLSMQKVAGKRDVVKQEQKQEQRRKSLKPPDTSQMQKVENPFEQQFLCMESKFLATFHAENANKNISNIGLYVKTELSTCQSILILKLMHDENEKTFRLYYRGSLACDHYETYKLSDFECIQELVAAKVPLIHNDETVQSLHVLAQWMTLFTFIPDYVVGIPIVYANGKVQAIVAIAFKNKLPKGIFEKISLMKDTLGLLVPYALITKGCADSEHSVNSYNRVLESIEKVEKAIFRSSAELGLTQIGTEVASLVDCKNHTVFVIDEGDQSLRKYHTSFGHPGRATCPNKRIHTLADIPMKENVAAPLTWVATHKQGMRINQLSDYHEFDISAKHIHSVGNCNTSALLVTPVVDYSGESALVIELADKPDGFTRKDFEIALLFCQHIACLLTCSVLLDRRARNFRRRNIVNEMLCQIPFVKYANVEQFITQHRKTSLLFKGHFDEFNMCIRCLPEQDISGMALEIFYELDLVKDFKIRRDILVRFIMSVQQGYGPMPYHNWNHAVSVMHFAYLLVKKLKLVAQGHLTKLEVFALIVSTLAHDCDHRGTNNQFQSYTKSEIYKLYDVEDSIMERHHLAVTLAILNREDCNILESLNDTDYKYFVELLTWNIISTDITKHMKSRDTLFEEAKAADIQVRKLARLSLFMTACDLCDNCKKWDDNLPTVRGILQEFFTQGDMERQLGLQPAAQMDRRVAYIPLIEYKFLKFVVLPVYAFLVQIYGDLKPCLQNIKYHEDMWARATYVYDKYKGKEGLEILEYPEMKEDNLLKIKLNESIDKVKHRKFSLPTPLVMKASIRAMARESISISVPRQSISGSTARSITPTASETTKKSRPSILVAELAEEDLKDVDTGENRRRFCPCCKKKQ